MRPVTGALLLALSVFALPGLGQSERHHLLRDSFVPPGPPDANEPRVAKRSRLVDVDLAPLHLKNVNRGQVQKLERLLTATLFPDARLQIALDRVERDGVDSLVWSGTVEGDPASSVLISIHDEQMTALFTTSSARYQVRPTARGAHEALELDLAGFPNEQEPRKTIAAASEAGAGAVVAAADTGAQIDVLVAYTNPVTQYYGTQSGVQTMISNAVAATNTAYANSGVTMRMRLVGTVEVAYDDRTAGFTQALDRLTNPADGVMDDVHALRNSLGADAVSLVVRNPTDNACGYGYVMTSSQVGPSFAPYAFNVTRHDCAVGNFSFAHELGHNFGLEHDRANASGSSPSRTYAYGYQDTTGLFRDIMSYNCPGGCPRVQYFSNPAVLYSGRPLGVQYQLPAAADAVRALNDNAVTIANWRTTISTPPAVSFTDDPAIPGMRVKAVHITELRTAVNSFRTAAGLAPATWTDASLTGVRVKATHIAELRTALTPALTAFGRTATYTGATVTGNIRAVLVQELRNLMK